MAEGGGAGKSVGAGAGVPPQEASRRDSITAKARKQHIFCLLIRYLPSSIAVPDVSIIPQVGALGNRVVREHLDDLLA